jgi:hypothetical protein
MVGMLLLAVIASGSLAADLWYEDNNLGKGGGMPPDFFEKFQRPETFSQASRYIRVYLMRANVLEKLDDQFLTTQFLPYLRKNDIKLAINAGGATFIQMGVRRKVFVRNIDLLNRLKRLGVQVDYVSLQSALDKYPRVDGVKAYYPLSKRIEDIVAFSKAVREIYPQAAIGLIDSLPSAAREYRQPYRQVKDALASAGIVLSYIHLDISFDIPREGRRGVTWKAIREAESYVEDELGLKFGYFTTSRKGGHHSSKAFHERVMAALECYADAGGTPGDLIVASWFPHPQKTIPETATGDDYPAMRTVLEYGRQLEQIEKDRPSWAAQRAREPERRTICTAP